MPDQAERAFANAVTRLNSKNLTHLWAVSCMLSGLDYFQRLVRDNGDWPLFPLLHPMKVVAFDWAVLKGTSQQYRSGRLTSNDLAFVLNNLNDASADPNFLEPVGDESNASRFLRHFSTMANKQFRFQSRDLHKRMGRSYLLNEDIPNRYRNHLRQSLGRSFLDIPTEFFNLTQLAPRDCLALGFSIIALLQSRFKDLLEQAADGAGSSSLPGLSSRQSQFLYSLLRNPQRLESISCFVPSALILEELESNSPTKIEAFLTTTARETRHLRELTRRAPYDLGFLSYRLSPLERYPIARLQDGAASSFVVPSLPYLDRLITELPHYVLQDTAATRSRYHETRGVVQEIYLAELLESQLPHLNSMAERRYDLPGGNWKGPDITLFDHKSGRLILIESKAARIQAGSMSDTALEPVLHDLRDAIDAVRRLHEKWLHFYQRLPEYQDVQEDLDRYSENQPVAVMVIGEGVEFLAEKVEMASQAGMVDSLRDLPFPYCFMDVETFEHAIQVAAASEDGFARILEEFWRTVRSGASHLNQERTADQFGGRAASEKNTYLDTAASNAMALAGRHKSVRL